MSPVVLVFGLLVVGAARSAAQVFTDVTAVALPGIAQAPGREGAEPGFTGGAAVGDCDGDGLPDVYFTGGNHDVLYRNRGDGTFEDVTVAANLGHTQGTRGAAFADVDGDGDLDLYATGYANARHFLYVNDGACVFAEDAVARGVAVGTAAIGRSASFGDYDRDGYLDLYVTELQSPLINPGVTGPVSHLFRNRGAASPGVFDEVTDAAGVSLADVVGTQDGTFSFTTRFSDLDRDGWPDLAVIADFAESRLFWNDGDGTFTDGTVAAGVGTDEHGMGATTADLDGDGLLDLFVTSIFIPGHPRGTGNRLYRNTGGRTFADVTDAAGVREGGWGWGTEAFDYDNDGDLDLVMTNGADGDPASDPFLVPELGPIDLSQFANDPVRLWRNDGGGVFTDVAAAAGVVDAGVGFGVVPFDYDGDGDLDLLLTHDGGQSPAHAPPRLFRNDGGNANHWLGVDLVGRCAPRHGTGAVVTMTPGDGGAPMLREASASSTYLAQDGTGRLHFGLGPGEPRFATVRVVWPGGAVQEITNVAIDRVLTVTESCTPPDELPDRAQQACVTGLLGAGRKVAAAAAANVVRCVRDGRRGALGPGRTVAQCAAEDPTGRLAKAQAKADAIEIARCDGAPDFGPLDAATVNAIFANLVDLADLLGDDLQAAIAAGAGACEQVVVTQVAKLADARVRAIEACAEAGLAARTITDPEGLAACSGADPRGRVAAAAARARAAITRRCAAVDVAAAFPGACAGASPASLGACVEDRVACDACRALDATGGTTRPCHRFAAGIAAFYCGERPATAHSVARQWNEENLDAIRIDLPRPPVHARNLLHLSVAMWDAWAAYDPAARGVLVTEKASATDVARAREAAISFAAYRVLAARYALSIDPATTAAALARRMAELGYDVAYTDTAGDGPAALGNRIAAAVLAHGLGDGANEAANYADATYAPANPPLVVKLPGVTMTSPNHWQPLALDLFISQNGIPLPGKVQSYVGARWGVVTAFADDLASVLPGPPPRLHDPASDAAFKAEALEVLQLASQLTPDDGVLIDVSPGAHGNNPLGSNAGTGHPQNPVTGEPYAPQIVRRGDFGRVLAEFWADGPSSETPPGHWNTVANYVSDNLTERRVGGQGPDVPALEWDVKLYLALNGALHDAAIGAWGTKRFYDSVRPISMIRYMAGLGQSSDPQAPSYHPDGLLLEPGVVEVVTAASSAPGERHAALADHVGEIAVRSWPGEPADPATAYSGVRWIRAVEWLPYQRSTFVTPPFAGYPSGHSTFSRAAAELLAQFTGSPWFPNGLGEFVCERDAFLQFEDGPSETVRLQWGTYYDAADQAGRSRLWGGIHIAADDVAGRIMGARIGRDAYAQAASYFAGSPAP